MTENATPAARRISPAKVGSYLESKGIRVASVVPLEDGSVRVTVHANDRTDALSAASWIADTDFRAEADRRTFVVFFVDREAEAAKRKRIAAAANAATTTKDRNRPRAK